MALIGKNWREKNLEALVLLAERVQQTLSPTPIASRPLHLSPRVWGPSHISDLCEYVLVRDCVRDVEWVCTSRTTCTMENIWKMIILLHFLLARSCVCVHVWVSLSLLFLTPQSRLSGTRRITTYLVILFTRKVKSSKIL